MVLGLENTCRKISCHFGQTFTKGWALNKNPTAALYVWEENGTWHFFSYFEKIESISLFVPYPIVWRKIFLCVFFQIEVFPLVKHAHAYTLLKVFFFFFAYIQSVFAMTTILGFWRMELSLLLLKFIVDVILFCVQIFLFFFRLFLLYRHMSVLKRKCQEQCHLPGDYYYRVLCNVQFSSVAQSCPTLCNPTDCSTPGLPDHHQLPEFTHTQVHLVGDAIQPSHPLSSPSPPAFNLSQHQGLFKWVSSLHQVAKVLEFQL